MHFYEEKKITTFDCRQVLLPYRIEKLKDGRYIVLNRLHKPLGVASDKFVIYEDHPTAITLKGLTLLRAKKLSARGDGTLESIYLYKDGCIPTGSTSDWDAYSERLKLLAKLRVE